MEMVEDCIKVLWEISRKLLKEIAEKRKRREKKSREHFLFEKRKGVLHSPLMAMPGMIA